MTTPFQTHFRDPCIHCATAHNDVAPGPCTGDPDKAIPVAWCSLGVRWDNVERFRILMSTGRVTERYEHIDMNLPWTYLKESRYDDTLRSRK
jgi:hypothetical protein